MTSRQPRILFVTPAWPLDRAFGGQLRALHLSRALQQVGDVSLLMVGAEAVNRNAVERTAAEFTILPPVLPHTTPSRSPAQQMRWALDTRYLDVHGFAATDTDRARVASYLPEFDLVWVLNSRTPNILQRWHWPHTHLDVDDLPSTYPRMTVRTTRNWVGRWKARTQHLLLRRRERRFGDRFTTLSVCSNADRSALGGGRVHVIPNGFARPATEPLRAPATNPPLLGFIGLYSYPPNQDGVRWFLRESWPAVRAAIPGIRFRLIGQDTDGALKPADPGVDALGWVDDPAREIATWSAMVVPIRLGGGTRIKLADAFSRQCPVVSTRFGAYGYQVENGRQLLLADDPAAFAAACIRLVREPASAQQIAAHAWNDFLEHWTWDAIAPKVWSAAEDCLRRSGTPALV